MSAGARLVSARQQLAAVNLQENCDGWKAFVFPSFLRASDIKSDQLLCVCDQSLYDFTLRNATRRQLGPLHLLRGASDGWALHFSITPLSRYVHACTRAHTHTRTRTHLSVTNTWSLRTWSEQVDDELAASSLGGGQHVGHPTFHSLQVYKLYLRSNFL